MTETLNFNHKIDIKPPGLSFQSPGLNSNLNLNTPYKFTDVNVKFNGVSSNSIPPVPKSSMLTPKIQDIGGKALATAVVINQANNYPKQFGTCMKDIREEYGPKGMYSDITALNARGYCAVKPITDTLPLGEHVSGALKFGLDGQARLNQSIHHGQKDNYSLLTSVDKGMTKLEDYASDKTLGKIVGDNMFSKNEQPKFDSMQHSKGLGNFDFPLKNDFKNDFNITNGSLIDQNKFEVNLPNPEQMFKDQMKLNFPSQEDRLRQHFGWDKQFNFSQTN
jgi:hypothetical protein